jgi:hypothetical protein
MVSHHDHLLLIGQGAPITTLHGPPMVRGVSLDDHLGRDDLVVRLPQFHPLVIRSARR